MTFAIRRIVRFVHTARKDIFTKAAYLYIVYTYICAVFRPECDVYAHWSTMDGIEGSIYIPTLSTEFKWHSPEMTCDQLFKRFKGHNV